MVTKNDVAILFAGAAVTGAIKGGEELYFILHPEADNKFPYLTTLNPLPRLDDWIVLAFPAVITAVGHGMKNDKVRLFGLGGLMFQGANFIRIIVARSGLMAAHKLGTRSLTNFTVPIMPIKEI